MSPSFVVTHIIACLLIYGSNGLKLSIGSPKPMSLHQKQESLQVISVHPKQESLKVAASEHKVFNMAFTSTSSDGGLMVARYLQGPGHYKQCKVPPRAKPGGGFTNWHDVRSVLNYHSNYALAEYDPDHELQFTPLQIPDNLVCQAVGEPKWVSLHGDTYIYGHGHGNCKPSMYEHLPSGFRETYADSHYKNYLMKFDHGKVTSSIVLAPPERIDPNDATMKNYLLFPYKNETYAITLFCPHRVHKVDLSTGLMLPAYDSDCKMQVNDYELGLGAGPLDLGDGTFLVAGHTRPSGNFEGGFGGERQTFFYTMQAEPPFHVVATSPPFSLGLSDHLEYINGLEQKGDEFVISMGVMDCDSHVLHVNKADILSRLVPV